MTENVRNEFNVHPGAHVGAQIGVMHGDIHQHDGASADVGALLGELRRAFDREAAAGRLDAETIADAGSELAASGGTEAAADPERRAGFLRAMRRVKGLVEDSAGLAAKVAAVIAAVKGL